jgi:hypothetical protein
LLEDALAETVLQGLFKDGDTIEATLDGETIKFEKSAKKPETEKPEKTDKAEKSDKSKKSDDKSLEEAASAGKN